MSSSRTHFWSQAAVAQRFHLPKLPYCTNLGKAFVSQLKTAISPIAATLSIQSSSTAYMHTSLLEAKSVFVRLDTLQKSFLAPYYRSFRVIGRKSKICLLYITGEEDWISIGCLKRAIILSSDTRDEELVNEGPHSSKSVSEPSITGSEAFNHITGQRHPA